MHITALSISGFRSLMDVTVSNMGPVCILHGLNNTGKSNVLSALEVIFRRKITVDETQTTVGEVTTHERPGNFWQGRITGFRDNFYKNQRKDIAFSVSVKFDQKELSFLANILSQLSPHLAKPTYDKILTISGKIKYVDEDSAEMVLEGAKFGTHVVFSTAAGGVKSFFPKLEALSVEDRLRSFEQLMNLLADSFALLPADRYLTQEPAENSSEQPTPILTPKTFKKWLFGLSLTRADHESFETIKSMFSQKPFSAGEISFNKERGEIEIMVKQSNSRLPISRLGSGYQQMLYIVAFIVLNRGKMLGIEELEINLSPAAQRFVFEKLKEYVRAESGLLSQVIITSHSEIFEVRNDVRCYGVTHDGEHTSVASWKKSSVRKRFFWPTGRTR